MFSYITYKSACGTGPGQLTAVVKRRRKVVLADALEVLVDTDVQARGACPRSKRAVLGDGRCRALLQESSEEDGGKL